MQIPKVHTGSYIICRTVSDAYTQVGTSSIVEDLSGDVDQVTLYNCRADFESSWLPVGTIMVIKEPSLKYDSYGVGPAIRVDSPSDVIFVDHEDRSTLEALGADKWYVYGVGSFQTCPRYVPSKLSADDLRLTGNKHFNERLYETALTYYDRACRLAPDSGVIHLNRAAALLQLERFCEAYDAAEKAFANGADREKALHRRDFISRHPNCCNIV